MQELAYFAPDWLKSQVEADWFERYGLRFEQYRLPKSKAERERLRLKIGIDGHHLLEALYRDSRSELAVTDSMRRNITYSLAATILYSIGTSLLAGAR